MATRGVASESTLPLVVTTSAASKSSTLSLAGLKPALSIQTALEAVSDMVPSLKTPPSAVSKTDVTSHDTLNTASKSFTLLRGGVLPPLLGAVSSSTPAWTPPVASIIAALNSPASLGATGAAVASNSTSPFAALLARSSNTSAGPSTRSDTDDASNTSLSTPVNFGQSLPATHDHAVSKNKTIDSCPDRHNPPAKSVKLETKSLSTSRPTEGHSESVSTSKFPFESNSKSQSLIASTSEMALESDDDDFLPPNAVPVHPRKRRRVSSPTSTVHTNEVAPSSTSISRAESNSGARLADVSVASHSESHLRHFLAQSITRASSSRQSHAPSICSTTKPPPAWSNDPTLVPPPSSTLSKALLAALSNASSSARTNTGIANDHSHASDTTTIKSEPATLQSPLAQLFPASTSIGLPPASATTAPLPSHAHIGLPSIYADISRPAREVAPHAQSEQMIATTASSSRKVPEDLSSHHTSSGTPSSRRASSVSPCRDTPSGLLHRGEAQRHAKTEAAASCPSSPAKLIVRLAQLGNKANSDNVAPALSSARDARADLTMDDSTSPLSSSSSDEKHDDLPRAHTRTVSSKIPHRKPRSSETSPQVEFVDFLDNTRGATGAIEDDEGESDSESDRYDSESNSSESDDRCVYCSWFYALCCFRFEVSTHPARSTRTLGYCIQCTVLNDSTVEI